MSFATVMVHIDIDSPRDNVIRVAAGIAARFPAMLIGVSAWEPRPPLTYGGVVVDPKISDEVIQEISADLARLAQHFRGIVGEVASVDWRASIEAPTEFVTTQARAADLLIIGRNAASNDPSRALDPGATVLKAGRPVLVVPPDVQSVTADHIVIGWKDTREARRAVIDALPLLRKASSVTIVEITEGREQSRSLSHVDDVAQYLRRHQVKLGDSIACEAAGSVASELFKMAKKQTADLIVAGGYGHNRFGEWLFGGVTDEFLRASSVCCLLSH